MPEVIHIAHVHEVLDFLRLSHDRWQTAQVVSSSHTWIFRGQGDARWPLVPKSLREPPPEPQGGMVSRAPWTALASEYSHTSSFLRLADEIGLLPSQDFQFGDFYKQVIEAASGVRTEPPEMSPSLLEAFALAQHHGVRTRFLDWSASPLAALFFAARDAFEAVADRDSFAVWAVPRQRPGDTRIRVVTPSFSRNNFAQRQLGYLTYDAEVDLHYNSSTGWPSQDTVLDEYNQRWGAGRWPGLRKVVVPSACAEEILSLLFQEGVSAAHLMPTLDNVLNTLDLLGRLYKQRIDRYHKKIYTGS